MPSGTTWPLPIYELALITAARIEAHGSHAVVKLVTPEATPLGLFGRQASDAVAALLAARGIGLDLYAPGRLRPQHVERCPAGSSFGQPSGGAATPSRACPDGRAPDADGFIPVDAHGVVEGFPDVYAAGDVTASSIKQGGIATQEADAVASAIAARFGAPVTPTPFRPVLRGMLLTGDGARFMRAEVTGGKGESSEISSEVLWWPEGKIAGRFLSPYLSRRAHAVEPEPPLTSDAIPVDVELASAGNGQGQSKRERLAAVDLYWLPLGAGGQFVRLNGRIYERLAAWAQRRPARDLYHSALEIEVPGRKVCRRAGTCPRPEWQATRCRRRRPRGQPLGWALQDLPLRGSALARRTHSRRCRGGGQPPSPNQRRGSCAACARVGRPDSTPVWGRDELGTGEMWNSNSVIAWLIARSGMDAESIEPPPGGRAPGWHAGLEVARRGS